MEVGMDSNKLPFSLFDFFALIFPGAIGVFGVYWLFDPDLALIRKIELDLTTTFLLIIFSYLLGHVFHAASEILIYQLANFTVGSVVGEYLQRVGLAKKSSLNLRKKIMNYLTNFKRGEWDPDILFEWGAKDINIANLDEQFGSLIKERLDIEFGTIPQRINHIFQLVLTYSQKNSQNSSNEVPVFAAVETMFRSLTLATSVLLVIFLTRHAYTPSIPFFATCIVFVLSIALFLYSHRRYKRMWVETIFAQFIVASVAQHPLAGVNQDTKPDKK
jgi:hypothetical protein